MSRYLCAALAACACQLLVTAAEARTPFDGSWSITFVTHSGDCNPSYVYPVNIENGLITSPGVQSFKGDVTNSGAVRASVSMQDKHATGSGKLTGVLGRGTWSGWSGDQRCAGAWTAQRTY
jgi:hypothetical protein